MSLPNDLTLQHAVMRLIGQQVDHRISLHDAIRQLRPQFPALTREEGSVPYGTSQSHFANRVQFAVAHLKTEGWLQKAPISGIGVWSFTTKARIHWNNAFPDGDQVLAEMFANEGTDN